MIIVVERECYSFRFSFPCYCFVIVTGDDIYYLGKLVVGNHEWVAGKIFCRFTPCQKKSV